MKKPKLTQNQKNYILQRASDIEQSFGHLNKWCLATVKKIGTDELPEGTEVIPLGNLQEAMSVFVASFKSNVEDAVEPKQKE